MTLEKKSPGDIVHIHSVTPSLPEGYKVPVDEQLEHLPILTADIQKATKDDNTLKKVTDYMQNRWPKTRKGVSKDVQVYFDRRHDLTIHNRCILRDLRVVILQSL